MHCTVCDPINPWEREAPLKNDKRIMEADKVANHKLGLFWEILTWRVLRETISTPMPDGESSHCATPITDKYVTSLVGQHQ